MGHDSMCPDHICFALVVSPLMAANLILLPSLCRHESALSSCPSARTYIYDHLRRPTHDDECHSWSLISFWHYKTKRHWKDGVLGILLTMYGLPVIGSGLKRLSQTQYFVFLYTILLWYEKPLNSNLYFPLFDGKISASMSAIFQLAINTTQLVRLSRHL